MPLYPNSFFLMNASLPFVVEDISVRGGFVTVTNAAARDALKSGVRKIGMLVYTQDDGNMWTIETVGGPFVPANLAKHIALGNALTIEETSGVLNLAGIDTAVAGQVLTVNSEGNLEWTTPAAGFKPTRGSANYTAPSSVAALGGIHDFTITMGKTVMLLTTTLSHVDLRLEAHSTAARNDSNPYKFISATGRLSDDGTSVLEDQSIQYNRRYAFLANLSETPTTSIYWRIVNQGSTAVTPVLNINYLVLEA